jgi:hypothetical protein
MSLLFNNVELLGYTHQNNFFGEKSLFYSSTRTVSIRGYVLDLASSNGVDGVFNGVNQLIDQTKDFQDININGQNFGRGKVKSFSVDAGNWVRYTRYQADIEVLLEVPIANINSPEFNGINIADKKLNLLKSFSENFSLNFDTQNKVLDGEHTIDIEYDANSKDINLINLAQILAAELLKTVPTNPDIAEGNYLTRQNYKVLNSENYNTIIGKCGFKRTFSYSTLNNNKNYSFVRTHSIEIGENGIATASENCSIKAESDEPSLYDNALTGYNELINDADVRCSAVFQNYKTKFNISEDLNPEIISKNVQVNKFNGTIAYTVTFDNDPKKENSNYLFEYTNTIDRDQNGIWNASEQGSIEGRGKIGSTQRYQNAENGWNSNKNTINSRVTNFYNAESKNGSGSLKDLSKNINRNSFEGKISYNYIYTDDRTILKNDPNKITKLSIEKSDTDIMPLTKDFIIPNRQYTLNQNRSLKKQGTYTIKVNMEIGCTNSNEFDSYKYFNVAKQKAGNFNVAGGQDSYLESISYSSEEIEKTITYQATYKYS